MDRKRKSQNASSSTPTKKRSTTPRPAKRYRRVTESGGTRISNVRTNGAKRLQDVKVIKVPNRRAGPGGFTIVATPRARIGDSGVIDGRRYVVRSEQELRSLIAQRKWSDVELTCTSRITDMSAMFDNAFTFNQSIGAWDTSRVTNMSDMFGDARTFNQPIGAWDTSRVVDMGLMFHGASAFNRPVNGWDTSRVAEMGGMFSGASAFNQPIGAWDTSRVTNMSYMFMNAFAFNQPIGAWDTSRVKDMSLMFSSARAFNRPVNGWDTSNVRDMSFMFQNAHTFNQPIGDWNVKKVACMDGMLKSATRFRGNVSDWDRRLGNSVSAYRAFNGTPNGPPTWWYSRGLHQEKEASNMNIDKGRTKRNPTRGRPKSIKNWTTNLYQNIQKMRTSAHTNGVIHTPPGKNDHRAKTAIRANGAIAQYMRNSGVKSPNIPIYIDEKPKFLYRGIHGRQLETLKKGYIRSNEFISFSRSLEIAKKFSIRSGNTGMIFRLDVSKLQHGIPWVWFPDQDINNRRTRSTVESSIAHEREVLFPPGELRLVRKIFSNGVPMYVVTYTPDPNAKSIARQKIVRRLGPAKRNIHHVQDEYERDVSNMFSELFRS